MILDALRLSHRAPGLVLGLVLALGPQTGEVPGKEELQEALQAAEAAELPEEVRARVVTDYNEALGLLGQVDGWRQAAAEHERERLAAPTQLTEIRAELRVAPEEPRLPVQTFTPLGELENRLRLARAELEAATAQVAELDAEPQRRAERRARLPERIAQLKAALQKLEVERGQPAPEGATEAEVGARQALLLVRSEVARAELAALAEELASYEARAELLPLRRDLAARRRDQAQKVVTLWQAAVEEQQGRETEKARRAAAAAQSRVDAAPAHLREQARRNAQLATEQYEVTKSLEAAAAREAELAALLASVEEDYEDARRRIEAAGLTDTVGTLLRRRKALLPNTRELRRQAAARRQASSDRQLRRFELEDLREELDDEAAVVAQLLAQVEGGVTAQKEERARALVREQRERITRLIEAYESLFVRHADVEEKEARLLATTTEFAGFIDERVLWIRSSPPLWEARFTDAPGARTGGGLAGLGWLVSPGNWWGVVATLVRDLRTNPVAFLLGLFVLLPLAAVQRRLRHQLRDAGAEAEKRTSVSMRPTVVAAVCTVLLAAFVPGVLAFFGWRLGAQLEATDFAKAVGQGLAGAAAALFLIEGVRQVCRGTGLGIAHFGWDAARTKRLRARLFFMAAVVVPLYFVALTLDAQSNEAWKSVVGRVALLVALLWLAGFLLRVLQRPHVTGRARAAGSLVRFVAVATPLAFAGLVVFGYDFTALVLVRRLVLSFGVVLTIVVAHGIAMRWVLVARRKLAREIALERRRERLEAGQDEAEIPVEEPEVDLEAVSQQSRQLLRSLQTIAMAVGLWLVWVDVLPALGFLNQFELWSVSDSVTQLGPDGSAVAVQEKSPITLGNVLFACIFVGLTLLAARNLPGLLEVTVLQRTSMGPGERYAVSTLVGYGILMVGVVFSFGAIGVGWSKVQWLAAAVSVGLGFGLQEIFANFVSGLIILFERPVRVGDYVTVGQTDGRVTRIRMRATTITDFDLRELIVPNKEFITGRLINWTLSNPITRVVLPVGIAYGSDTEKARRILLEIARGHPLVLREPNCSVLFAGFGDSTLNLQLRVFIENRDLWPEVVTTINTQIHLRFAQAGLEIAFPQRDLHLRTAEPLERLFKRQPGFSVEEIGESS